MAQPWIKFYPRDWRGDQALRAVSLAARGLWMEMLCIMHEASPYGHLVLGGHAVSNDVLSRVAGTSVDEVSALLIELESAGVLSRTRKGVIYSRRMVKDRDRSEKGRKAVNKRYSQGAENLGEKPQASRLPSRSPATQKPEARSQNTPLPPNGGAKAYAFTGRTVRLTQDDFDRWKQAYSTIPDLKAELTAIDDWLDGADEAVRKRWFHSVSRMLGRKHEEAIAARKSGFGGGTDAFVRRMENYESQRRAAQQQENCHQ